MEESHDEITQRIRAFVLTKLEPRGITQVDDRDSLVASGVVDSLGVFQLVAFLEDAFDIRVRDEEIALEHFESVQNTARFVATKKGLGERKA
ncbi:MAG TPA: acyl carrier protein [Candidatus Krumholzibacteria bacterium]|jgi:acyl carrier protein|nr:acyl carrier protein [Candidatus Krumholzibacteria bacterium]